MTVKDLRVLVDNLDEFVRIPGGVARLRKTVLHLAVSGKLVPQFSYEGTGDQLFSQIQIEKDELTKAGLIKKPKIIQEIEQGRYEAPASWKWVHLSEVTNLITDGTHHTPNYKSDGIPFLSIKDVSAGKLDFSNSKFISQREHNEINKRCNPERGDILFCRIGTLGKPVIVDVDKPFSIFVSLGLIKFSQNLLLPEYLRLYLQAPDTYRQYREIMAGGSHTNKLNLNSMNSLAVALPPIREQLRIVKKIEEVLGLVSRLEQEYCLEQELRQQLTVSSLSDLVKNNSSLALELLKETIKTENDIKPLKDTFISLAIRGRLASQIPIEGTGLELKTKILFERSNQATNTSHIESSEAPFDIPSSWEWARLGDLTNMSNGYAFKSSNWKTSGIPIVRIQNLNNQNAPFNYVDVGDVESKYIVDDGQVLLSWSGTPGTSFGVFIWNRGKAALNQHIFKCDVYGVDHNYFRIAANQAIYSKLAIAHGGVGLKHLTKPQLDSLQIPLPPLKEQKRIIDKLNSVFEITEKISF